MSYTATDLFFKEITVDFVLRFPFGPSPYFLVIFGDVPFSSSAWPVFMLLTEALRSRLLSCRVMRMPVSPSAGSPDRPFPTRFGILLVGRTETSVFPTVLRLRTVFTGLDFPAWCSRRWGRRRKFLFPHRRLRCGGSSMQLGGHSGSLVAPAATMVGWPHCYWAVEVLTLLWAL